MLVGWGTPGLLVETADLPIKFHSAIVMVFIGIDVEKDKHDYFIIGSEGEVLAEVVTITNNRAAFEWLPLKIRSCAGRSEKIKVGLEATGQLQHTWFHHFEK